MKIIQGLVIGMVQNGFNSNCVLIDHRERLDVDNIDLGNRFEEIFDLWCDDKWAEVDYIRVICLITDEPMETNDLTETKIRLGGIQFKDAEDYYVISSEVGNFLENHIGSWCVILLEVIWNVS